MKSTTLPGLRGAANTRLLLATIVQGESFAFLLRKSQFAILGRKPQFLLRRLFFFFCPRKLACLKLAESLLCLFGKRWAFGIDYDVMAVARNPPITTIKFCFIFVA